MCITKESIGGSTRPSRGEGRTRHRHGRHLWTDLDAFLNSRSQQLTSQHGLFFIYIYRLEPHHVSDYSTPQLGPHSELVIYIIGYCGPLERRGDAPSGPFLSYSKVDDTKRATAFYGLRNWGRSRFYFCLLGIDSVFVFVFSERGCGYPPWHHPLPSSLRRDGLQAHPLAFSQSQADIQQALMSFVYTSRKRLLLSSSLETHTR